MQGTGPLLEDQPGLRTEMEAFILDPAGIYPQAAPVAVIRSE